MCLEIKPYRTFVVIDLYSVSVDSFKLELLISFCLKDATCDPPKNPFAELHHFFSHGQKVLSACEIQQPAAQLIWNINWILGDLWDD